MAVIHHRHAIRINHHLGRRMIRVGTGLSLAGIHAMTQQAKNERCPQRRLERRRAGFQTALFDLSCIRL
jgi:hypothetical protein